METTSIFLRLPIAMLEMFSFAVEAMFFIFKKPNNKKFKEKELPINIGHEIIKSNIQSDNLINKKKRTSAVCGDNIIPQAPAAMTKMIVRLKDDIWKIGGNAGLALFEERKTLDQILADLENKNIDRALLRLQNILEKVEFFIETLTPNSKGDIILERIKHSLIELIEIVCELSPVLHKYNQQLAFKKTFNALSGDLSHNLIIKSWNEVISNQIVTLKEDFYEKSH